MILCVSVVTLRLTAEFTGAADAADINNSTPLTSFHSLSVNSSNPAILLLKYIPKNRS